VKGDKSRAGAKGKIPVYPAGYRGTTGLYRDISTTERAVPALPGAATPVSDESQKWWYKVSGSGWLPQNDVEEVNQYDLRNLGFRRWRKAAAAM
jgi:hypothetical protein